MASTPFKSLLPSKREFVLAILLPYIFTRLLLTYIGWFGQYLPSSPNYDPQAIKQGYVHSSYRFLDIWSRWDSNWYFTIISDGYQVSSDPTQIQSNIAFPPGYPMLVKLFSLIPLPFFTASEQILIWGLVVSNLSLIISLLGVYVLAARLFKNPKASRIAVWLALAYPGSFFLSAFYSESLFFSLSIWFYIFVINRIWLPAVVLGTYAVLTRPTGPLLLLPGLIEVFVSHKSLSQRLKFTFLLVLMLLGLVIHSAIAQLAVGDYLAPLIARQAWQTHTSLPWQALLNPRGFIGYITPLDKFFVLAALLLLIMSTWAKKLPLSLIVYSLASILMPLVVYGHLHSSIRYLSFLFPLTLALAYFVTTYPWLKLPIILTFMSIQAILFLSWSQFYWVG